MDNKKKTPVKRKRVTNKIQQTKRALIEALTQTLGVVTSACKSVDVDRSTFYKYINEDAEFAREVRDIQEIAVDFAESKLHEQIGDCLQKLKELKDNSVDSVVTDPPYEIGFMGKGWDDSGIANNPELWKEVLRVLKPGGHLLSFSHSRTYHRQAVAVEDAGFEIRDQIMWIYGSGFPKSHNIGKAVDKIQGNERDVLGRKSSNRNLTKRWSIIVMQIQHK
jgi:ACT domain-containing protein